MDVNFSNIDMYDRQILILKRPDETPVGVLGDASEITLEAYYNEVSKLSFKLPQKVNGVRTPLYDEVVGLMIVELKGIGQFVINAPQESGDKVSVAKSVTAQSLECEFVRKKITLPESTYRFFDSMNTDGTVLGMIMELMPTWSVGYVAGNIANKYRTFDVSNDNLYNFIKGTVQQSFNCIFEFDTINRIVNVRDADEEPAQKQVFISRDNLARDITVKEETDDIVTRLDVNGADGVDIRDVNPTGTNQIINLDYFVSIGMFSDALSAKYNSWKTLVNNNKTPFYNYAVQYALRVSEEIAENAKLADLRGEYTSIENVQAAIIQGIASGIRTQSDLDEINEELSDKQDEIDAQNAVIQGISTEKGTLFGYMNDIIEACSFTSFFTAQERSTLDPYIIDNEIQDSTFVSSDVRSYSEGNGDAITGKTVSITGATVTSVESASQSVIYSVSGGSIVINGIVESRCISAIFERRNDGKVIISIYAGNGEYMSASFPSACISISGSGSVTSSSSSVSATISSGTIFFSLNATDYEKKSVAWDLYQYGEALIQKMAYPSYSFSVDSANFIALDGFELFKNELELGQSIYIEVSEGKILNPVCTGAKIYFDDRPKLELLFTDTFTAMDGKSKLIDILEKSVSMGKTLSAGKFTYEAWSSSGAESDLKSFMNSALDTAKNAIMSSTGQAVSWDGAGLRMRKYADEAQTAYEGEQIWMSNNSIMMTDDGWATAKMAIGKFHDANAGDQWGIIAPMVVGTLLAGESLVIESEKKSGGTSVFRVDGDGAKLFNADFEIQKTTGNTTTQILLDPSVGIAIGTYPLKKSDGTLDTGKAKFYVDANGNMVLTGTIHAGSGDIGGWTISSDGLYSGTTDATSVGMTSSGDIRIWAGKLSANKSSSPFYVKQDGTVHAAKGDVGGWNIGSDYIGNAATKAESTVGVASGTGTSIVFWAGNAQASAPFRVQADGTIVATKGTIGGWNLGSDYIGNAATKAGSTVGIASGTGTNIVFWAGGTQASAPFMVKADGTIASTKGTIGGWNIGSDYIGNSSTKAGSTAGIASGTGTSIVFWAGGAQASAPFRVQADGTIVATKGTIGGWNINANSLYAGSGATYVAFSTSGDYALWAGNETASSAPFRVKRDGTVYSSKFIIVGEDGAESTIDLRNYSLWKLNYATVKNVSVSGNTLTIQTTAQTVNFNKATASSLVAEGGGGFPNFTVKAVHYEGSSTPIVDDSGIVSGALSDTPYGISSYVSLMFEGHIYGQVPVGAVYTNGREDGEAAVTLSGSWDGLTYTANASNGKHVLTTISDVDQRGVISYNPTTHNSTISVGFYTGDGADHSKGFTVPGDSAFSAGVTAGEGHFSLASVILQGAKYLSTATYYTAGTPATYYKGSTGTYYQAATTLYKAGTPATYYKGSTGSYYSAATTLYKAGTKATYYKGSTGSYYSAATTLYKAGSATTVYPGDGSAGYLRGDSVSVTAKTLYTPTSSGSWSSATYYVVNYSGSTLYRGNGGYVYGRGTGYSVTPIGDEGTKLTVNTRGDSIEVTPIGDEGTKLTVNTRGDSVNVTPIGDEGTKLTVNTRGDSVSVTPIGNSVTRYSANPNSVSLYEAGSSYSNTYYTKTS